MRFTFRLMAAVLMATPLLPMSAPPVWAQSVGQSPAATITLTGEGVVSAAPDMATISIGVMTEGKTAAEAMAANSAQLAQVLENLRAAGIADRDLQTSGLSLNPNWANASGSGVSRIVGYVASNQLSVRVRVLDSLGMVLDAAVRDGANQLNGVSFGVADPAPLLAAARKRAVADARAKADLFTQAAGVGLGAVLAITEQQQGGGQPMYRGAAMAMEAAVPVAEGEISVSAQVTLVWGLTPR
ncbi:MAG: SIMPL domain-containing protein [Pseudorhodobacter sp.]|nr:SIMPL domain-containing protein [Pseudorhodobacter sp.]